MRDLLEALRDEALRLKVDFMDARAVETESVGLARQDGRTDKAGRYHSRGLGVRVLLDRAWGFASMDGCVRDRAFDCLASAVAMARACRDRVGESGVLAPSEPVETRVPAVMKKDPRSVSLAEKMKLVEQYDQAVIAAGNGKLVNTSVSYSDSVQRVLLCNTRGTFLETEFARVSLGAGMTGPGRPGPPAWR